MLYITDQYNHRIVKRALDLSYDSKIGSNGSGNDQFNYPIDITVDNDYLYVCDDGNSRIVKRSNTDLSYVSEIGPINDTTCITTDGTHIYSLDGSSTSLLVKRLCSDLSFVTSIGGNGNGNDEFDRPQGITTDGIYLYISDYHNDRIVKRLCSDLSYDSQGGSYGSGNDNFEYPLYIVTDTVYLYIWDDANDRIIKRKCSDLSYVDQLVFAWDIGYQCYTTDGTYLYFVTREIDPSEIHTLQKYTIELSPISSIGGVPGSGNDQFNRPYGITSDEWFSLLISPEPPEYATQMRNNGFNQAQFLTKCGGNIDIKEKLINLTTLVEQEKIYNPIVDDVIVVTPNPNNVIETFIGSPLPAKTKSVTTKNSSGSGNDTPGATEPPLTEGDFRALIQNLFGEFTDIESQTGYS